MFKTTLTAAALALTASLAHAAPGPLDPTTALTAAEQIVEQASGLQQVSYYCEWVTLYDYWGNWVTVWQCY